MWSAMASTSGGSAAASAPSSSRMSDVVHVDELHVESDDLVTKVVDVTGGSDDEVRMRKRNVSCWMVGWEICWGNWRCKLQVEWDVLGDLMGIEWTELLEVEWDVLVEIGDRMNWLNLIDGKNVDIIIYLWGIPASARQQTSANLSIKACFSW